MGRSAALALLVAGLAVGRAAPGLAAPASLTPQEVILRTKPATVLVVSEVAATVTLDCGAGRRQVTPAPFRETGTGWFVDSNGWVMTNAHVVQPAHQLPRWVTRELAQKAVTLACVGDELTRRNLEPGDQPELEERLRREAHELVLPGARVEPRPAVFILLANGFRLPAKVAKYSPPVSTQRGAGAVSGRDLALLQVEAAEMPAFKLADSRHVKLGDPIRILGYPGVVLTHEMLDSTAKVEASITNGAVSGFKQDVQGQSVIQTDAPAAWGNSGGPAIDGRGDVVGVLTFVSLAPGPEGAIVQGFNFVIPAEAVKEFLAGTPVDLADRSPFDARWHGGLRRFFSGDWAGAAALFREADRLQPEFPDVRRMLAEAEEKTRNPPPLPFPWPLAAITLGLGVAGAGTLLVGRRRRARRERVAAVDVVRLFEAGETPIILDARAPGRYELSPFRIAGDVRATPGHEGELALEPGRTVVVYCSSRAERSSALVAAELRRRGHRDVRVLDGGLGGWTNAGLPLASKPVARAWMLGGGTPHLADGFRE